MDFEEFLSKASPHLLRDTVYQNPGGGTSTISRLSGDTLVYRRKNSDIPVSLRDFYSAYIRFRGTKVSSNDLKIHAPRVFDSTQSGHSCNCTMLFILLKAMGQVKQILGRGVRGNPFWVYISAEI